MRHRMHGRKLGRTSAHRKAMFRNQLTSLFAHERIVTTIDKAKELRPLAERMVTLACNQDLASRRRIASWVSDKVVLRRLFDEIAPRFEDRPGGYTRILRLGRRKGDNAQMAIIEFIDYELSSKSDDDGGGETKKRSLMQRMFGAGGAAALEDSGEIEVVAKAPDDTEVEAEAADDTEVEAKAPDDTEVEAEAADDTEVETEEAEAQAEVEGDDETKAKG